MTTAVFSLCECVGRKLSRNSRCHIIIIIFHSSAIRINLELNGKTMMMWTKTSQICVHSDVFMFSIWVKSLWICLLFLQVVNVSLMKGEQVTVEDTGGREPFILANESVLMRGLVVRSWSNQISIRFRSDRQQNSGFIQLHYQGKPAVLWDVLYIKTN